MRDSAIKGIGIVVSAGIPRTPCISPLLCPESESESGGLSSFTSFNDYENGRGLKRR